MIRSLSYIALATTLAACGTTHEPDRDAGEADAATTRDAATVDAAAACVPGSSRVMGCGNCGSLNEVCGPDGRWAAVGDCVGAGICAAGAVETESTDRCGTRSRTCDAACEWEEWTQTVPDGACVTGEVRRDETACGPSAVQVETCGDTCEWGVPECQSLCAGTRRTEPADAEEICIPAGPFIRGSDDISNAQPVREVMMSAYYIDRYPASNRRYQTCVDAGECTQPGTVEGRTSLSDIGRLNYPVQGVTRTQAIAFCAWDGARYLPTEAQWEKAARGPSPRAQSYAWDGEFACSYVTCNASLPPTIAHPIDGRPLVRSYYGVDLMLGGGYEWTHDLYSLLYYSDPESLTDPQGQDGTGYYVCRGYPAGTNSATVYNVAQRRACHDSSAFEPSVIRCARMAGD